MKILLLGNARAPYLESLRSAISNGDWEVEIFDPYSGQFSDASGQIASWGPNRGGNRGLIARAGRLRRFLKQRCGHYDIVNVHYHSTIYGLAVDELSRAGKKLIVSIWGDDLMAVRGFMKVLQNRVYRCCHAVTINNPERVCDFERRFPEVVERIGKPEVCFLPIGILTEIDRLKREFTREEIRNSLGFAPDEVVIACGTEGSSTQRHLQILRSLELSAGKLPGRCVLVFPISYGGSPRYVKKLRKALAASRSLAIRVIDRFLSIDELVRWRCATDVLVLVQTQDQFKAAVQELLYTGCRIVVGRWLPYGFLEARGLDIHQIDSVSDVGRAVADAIPHHVDVERRQRLVREIASEESAGRVWRELYHRTLGAGTQD